MMRKVLNLLSCLLFLSALVPFAPSAGNAQSDAPAGRVEIETTSIAAGIGMSWGDGKLSFKGRTFRFSIDGVTFMDFGFSKASAAGAVYNLSDIRMFEGNYVAAEANIALGGGIGTVSLRNSNGVIIRLNAASQGARLQLGSSGMNIKLW